MSLCSCFGDCANLHCARALAGALQLDNEQHAAGVTTLLDEAIDNGAAIAVLAGTSSMPEEHIAEGAKEALGNSRAAHIRMFNSGVESAVNDDVEDRASLLTFEQSKAAAEAKVSWISTHMSRCFHYHHL